MSNMPGRKLTRPTAGRLVAGVAAGLADYFGVDVTLVRVIWAIVACFGGFGVIAYLAAWLIIPEQGESESIAERLVKKTGG
jgi:phage shock protein PspC (stress-responsive transcriptional regulator)